MADEFTHAYCALKQSSLRGGAEALRGGAPCAAETPNSHETRKRILQRDHAAQSAQAHAHAAGMQRCPTAGMRSCPRAELARQHPVFSLPRSAGPRDQRQVGCDVTSSRAQSTANAEEHGAAECPVRSCKRWPSFACLCVPWLTRLSASALVWLFRLKQTRPSSSKGNRPEPAESARSMRMFGADPPPGPRAAAMMMMWSDVLLRVSSPRLL